VTWGYIFLAGIGLMLLGLVVLVFRHGSRSSHLDRIPLYKLALYTFGVTLLGRVVDWIQPDAGESSLATKLAAAGFYFVMGCLVWLAGFSFGRWRAAKLDGIIRGR